MTEPSDVKDHAPQPFPIGQAGAAAPSVPLGSLDEAEAVGLFMLHSGHSGPVDATVTELVDLCRYGRLAIRVCAAYLRRRPGLTLTDLTRVLRERAERFEDPAWEAGERAVALTLDLAYTSLTGAQRRMYRLLGLHPGRDADLYAAAALADMSPARAWLLLQQIVDAQLLESTAGRYSYHQLVRREARRMAVRDESEPHRLAAAVRLLDNYRWTAAAAMDIAYAYEPERRPRRPPTPSTAAPGFVDPVHAANWLDNELANLMEVTRYACDHNLPDHVIDLAGILHRHLRNRGRYREAETLHQRAVITARAMADVKNELDALTKLADLHRLQGQHDLALYHFEQALRVARANRQSSAEVAVLSGLGAVHRRQGRYTQALVDFARACEVARVAGDRAAEAHALNGSGDVHRRQGSQERAAEFFEQALEVARVAEHRRAEMNALNGLGDVHRRQGRFETAVAFFGQALEVARMVAHRPVELQALTGLADVDRDTARLADAVDRYQQVLHLARETGDRGYELEARHGLGRLHQAMGEPQQALVHHRKAFEIATDLGQPVERARACDGLARAHASLREPEQAQQLWQAALDFLEGVGAEHADDHRTMAEAIRDHLARLGNAG